MFKWKRKVITSENISIEENTKVFIKDFLILVKNGKKETVQNQFKRSCYQNVYIMTEIIKIICEILLIVFY